MPNNPPEGPSLRRLGNGAFYGSLRVGKNHWVVTGGLSQIRMCKQEHATLMIYVFDEEGFHNDQGNRRGLSVARYGS